MSLDLRVGAQPAQAPQEVRVDHEAEGEGQVGRGELFEDPRGRRQPETESAVTLGEQQAAQALAAGEPHRGAGVLAPALPSPTRGAPHGHARTPQGALDDVALARGNHPSSTSPLAITPPPGEHHIR